jgi:hypothetical protein
MNESEWQTRRQRIDARLRVREWTPSRPLGRAFALSLREIRLARSQRARLRGEFVPPKPADEPAASMLERIEMRSKNTDEPGRGRRT